jgi:predicted  nucleic acid-binding Zn-ribbon protein
MKNKNIVEISELQRFQTRIENLTGEASAVSALISSSITDLQDNQREMKAEIGKINELIENLTAQKSKLETNVYESEMLITELTEAFKTVAEHKAEH